MSRTSLLQPPLVLTASREITLNTFKKIALATLFFATPLFAQIGITIGTPEPNCTYGYYDYAPYSCAPYGYYGPEFFVGGHYHPRRAWGRNDDHRRNYDGYRQKKSSPYGHDKRDRKGNKR